MRVGDVDVGLLDQLKEDDIDAAVKMKILSFIQESKFKVFSAMLGKAKEGVGGFQLVLMSETLMEKTSETIVVPGMKPWD